MELLKYSEFTNNNSNQKHYAGVLPYCPKTKRFLLNLRSFIVNNPNVYSSWGGKVENRETPIQAAEREFIEESGYDKLFTLQKIYTHRKQKEEYIKKYHLYITILDDEFTPVLDKESNGYKWVSFDQLYRMDKNKLHTEFYKTLKDIKFTLAKFVV